MRDISTDLLEVEEERECDFDGTSIMEGESIVHVETAADHDCYISPMNCSRIVSELEDVEKELSEEHKRIEYCVVQRNNKKCINCGIKIPMTSKAFRVMGDKFTFRICSEECLNEATEKLSVDDTSLNQMIIDSIKDS